MLPRTVIYDPELTLSLPLGLTVTSGINAIAHSAEGLYAKDGNPIMDLMAEEGIRAIADALPALKKDARTWRRDRRRSTGHGCAAPCSGTSAWRCITSFATQLGGSFNLPHAEVHTVILPHAIAYNAPAIPAALIRMQRALQSGDAAAAL